MINQRGRACALDYQYTPLQIRQSPLIDTDVLYVAGGVYGNVQALNALQELVDRESATIRTCFNGDFNWFNREPARFREINERCLAHDAIRGNVETEIARQSEFADCGCAYPEWVADSVVEWSNTIIQSLKATAAAHPDICRQLASLPMFKRYRVGGCSLAVLHGDPQSLAGWGLAQEVISNPAQQELVSRWSAQMNCPLIACTHTCLPYLYHAAGICVINNGAAGMPNFANTGSGIVTRIATHAAPSTLPVLYGAVVQGVHIDAISLRYEQDQWMKSFADQWPEGSAAHLSYWNRMQGKLDYSIESAIRTGQ